MPELVAMGETMVLFTPDERGPLRYARSFHMRIGGAESNVCIGLARLGRSAGWISRLGDDQFGRFVLAQIRGEGVDTSGVRTDASAPTGIYFKETREVGGTEVVYYRRGSAASKLERSDLDLDYLGAAKVFLVSGITAALSANCRDALEWAIAQVRRRGVTVALDPNVRLKLWSAAEAREVLVRLCRSADWVLPGLDEAELMTGCADPEDAARRLLDLGVSQVYMKLGAEGSLVAHGGGVQRVSGFAVPRVVDPIGAGDAYAAGVIAALLEGRSPAEAARFGNASGALAVTVAGDIEALPTRRELDAFMAASAGGRRPDVVR
ncbi:MAG TPA: sugar kinase [Limnochordia bacterium]|nr:sugar kinase [Limnochordia bacterium]